jgi:hypothetical protein
MQGEQVDAAAAWLAAAQPAQAASLRQLVAQLAADTGALRAAVAEGPLANADNTGGAMLVLLGSLDKRLQARSGTMTTWARRSSSCIAWQLWRMSMTGAKCSNAGVALHQTTAVALLPDPQDLSGEV